MCILNVSKTLSTYFHNIFLDYSLEFATFGADFWVGSNNPEGIPPRLLINREERIY
jgi:hypothetical protein